jgi:drug/metabolite transporter (DMT)-like permease
VVIWGGSYSAVKSVQAMVPPVPLATLRCLVAALVLAGVLLAVGRRVAPLSRSEWATVALLGLSGNTVFQLCMLTGLTLTTPTHSALMINLSPIFATLLSWVWLHEPLGGRRAAGILLALGGAALIVTRGAPAAGPASVGGDLLSLGGAVAWAVYSVVAKPLLATRPALEVTTLATAVGAVPLLAVGLPGLAAVSWAALGPAAWLLLGYLSVVTIVVTSLLWFWALARAATARIVAFSYLTPVVAATISVALGQETLTAPLVAGAVAVISGIALAQLH